MTTTNTETTNTETTVSQDFNNYWEQKQRADAEWLAAHAGRILEVNRRSAGYDGDYYDVYDVTVWTGEGLDSRRFGHATGSGLVADAPAAIVDAANDLLEDQKFDALVRADLESASTPDKGKLVVIARGKAKHADGTPAKGFEGEIFWSEARNYTARYSNGWKRPSDKPDAVKVGIAPVGARVVNGKREGAVFTYARNCDVLLPDAHMTDPAILRDQARGARRFRVAKVTP